MLVVYIPELVSVSGPLVNYFFGLEELSDVLEGCFRDDDLTTALSLPLRTQRPHQGLTNGEGLGAAEHATDI